MVYFACVWGIILLWFPAARVFPLVLEFAIVASGDSDQVYRNVSPKITGNACSELCDLLAPDTQFGLGTLFPGGGLCGYYEARRTGVDVMKLVIRVVCRASVGYRPFLWNSASSIVCL